MFGGRLDYAFADYDTKHQYLIPKQNPIAYLLIRDTHKAVGHLVKTSTLIELRKTFWIRMAGVPTQSLYYDLLEDRAQSDINPVSHTWMDYFG